MGALSTSDGTPTGGIYGFAAIAMEIVKNLQPTKVVVAWDSKSSTAKRKAIFADYKAGRVKPGEDFYAQIPLLKELILALGWNFVEVDEYEADDIIGALSLQADQEGDWETFIVSSDLDMLQIVDENTRMYRVLKGFSKLEELDVPAVEAKYGIKKSQFLDLKALKGDASDNIPGVPGVGEKTAVKLLNDYGSLDGVYEHLDEISGKVHDKLEQGKESAKMSYELAKIQFDAPVKLKEMIDLKIDRERIFQALDKLEFRSLKRKFWGELSGGPSGGSSGGENPSLESSDSAQAKRQAGGGNSTAQALTTSRKNVVKGPSEPRPEVLGSKVDTSKVGSQKAQIGQDMAFSAYANSNRGGQQAMGLNFGQQTLEIPHETDEGVIISWDVKTLMHKNTEIAEKILSGTKFWDLGQGSFLLNPLARNIEYGDEQEEYTRQKKAFLEFPRLYKIFVQFDLPLIPILYKMEKIGMLIDRSYFKNLSDEFTLEVKKIEQQIFAVSGTEFNINSPIQLSEVLFTKLMLPTAGIKKTARGYSTGAKELDKLEGKHEIIPLIKKYREVAKLLSTYITPLPGLADEQGRVHTTFTQNVTATGRLSSTNPNLQNIPVRTEEGKRIRRGFVAPEGKVIVSADYSQFELRLAAALGNDTALVNDFNNDVDIHTKTASEAFGVAQEAVSKQQRRAAKVINFGVLYGMSVRGLAAAADMSFSEAKSFIEHYFELRRPIKDYLERTLEQARNEGFVETYFGRRRPTPDVKSSNFVVRTGAERAAQNMPIQGTEADLMKRAMIEVDKILPEGAKMIMQVHDSLMVECDEAIASDVAKLLQEKMEGVAPELNVKLAVDVSIGDNWGEL